MACIVATTDCISDVPFQPSRAPKFFHGWFWNSDLRNMSRLTHFHLFSKEPPPTCTYCSTLLTVEHIFSNCSHYLSILPCLQPSSLRGLATPCTSCLHLTRSSEYASILSTVQCVSGPLQDVHPRCFRSTSFSRSRCCSLFICFSKLSELLRITCPRYVAFTDSKRFLDTSALSSTHSFMRFASMTPTVSGVVLAFQRLVFSSHLLFSVSNSRNHKLLQATLCFHQSHFSRNSNVVALPDSLQSSADILTFTGLWLDVLRTFCIIRDKSPEVTKSPLGINVTRTLIFLLSSELSPQKLTYIINFNYLRHDIAFFMLKLLLSLNQPTNLGSHFTNLVKVWLSLWARQATSSSPVSVLPFVLLSDAMQSMI